MVLAADPPADTDKAAPLGLFMILALVVVSIFLARSMIKHIRKIPKGWGDETVPDDDGPRLGERTPSEADTLDEGQAARLSSYQSPPRLGTPPEYAEKSRVKSAQKSKEMRKIAARKAALKSRPADSKTRSAKDKPRAKRP